MSVRGQAWFNEMLKKLRHPYKRTWIILNPASIGETVTVCALSDAFVKAHGYSITMVVQPHHLAITEMYPNRFEQVLVEDRDVILEIMRHCPPHQFDIDVPLAGFFYNLGDARADAISYLFKYPGRGGLTFTDTYRHIFKLPWDARLERPIVPVEWMDQAQNFVTMAGIDTQHAIILFPANNSAITQFPDIFWTTLAARLNQNGYQVLCNMKGGQFQPDTMPIAGTIPIDVSMQLGLPLISLIGKVIGGANGMLFWQAMGGLFDEMTVLFPMTANDEDVLLNERIYPAHLSKMQFMAPEVCVDIPFSEFGVPFSGSEKELIRLARSIADQSLGNPDRFQRYSADGSDYISGNAQWLRALIAPIPIRQS
ncbi:hypothetical protein RGU70_01695 [Herbaspirillum sp. RTI4]|uniref:hypothetical protein n=1 Tax=Herbaspirillum sp. RTI4 TaxID=3048640 RepID=UPI002AB59700|nr:hypothetical protein [Herbaspirillum sp. RTI4]MDY7577039.1 hypothetical protein [Herbaspirillum sp. RTI4]MEA9982219.1 hypothetical protein [Herbaspirillum sp. RTI4]